MRDHIHQPGHAFGSRVKRGNGAGCEQGPADIAGHSQTMREVKIQLPAREHTELILKSNALSQLTHGLLTELVFEFGLAE